MKDIVNGENELDIADIAKNGISLLVDTSHMPRISRIYLTNLLVYQVASYVQFHKEEFHPILVYVDEFQTVASEVFSDLLATCRSKNVGFVIAHHDFKEIDEDILSAIRGNVDINVIFRCGITEAKLMSQLFEIEPIDLINLEKFQAWVRIDNRGSLVSMYPPVMNGVPELNLPELKADNGAGYKFLRDNWIETLPSRSK